MSSFKRKSNSKSAVLHPGTRLSPSSPATTITSTGIPSLDDVLGGGLPLSCVQLVIAPDPHTSYGELVQKYFVAQGLVSGQAVHIVDVAADDFVKDIMWTPKGGQSISPASTAPANGGLEAEDKEEEEEAMEQDQKIKIAWRYEQMKQFKTTITTSSPSSEDFCQTFDLTSRVPESLIEGALRSGQLSYLEASDIMATPAEVFAKLSKFLENYAANISTSSSSPPTLRICIPALGSASWGDITSRELLHFVHSLRILLRRYPFVCASIALPSHVSTDMWGGPGWSEKLGWVSDAAIVLSAFSANVALALTFPLYHGFLRIISLPAPHTVLAPSDKFSTLRGLSSSAVSIGGSGENNLAFKCTRKRMIFETLHLDLEGGVGERRTTAPIGATATVGGNTHHHTHDGHKTPAGLAAVNIELEGDAAAAVEVPDTYRTLEASDKKPKKPRKKVAFHSDRPDLYDF